MVSFRIRIPLILLLLSVVITGFTYADEPYISADIALRRDEAHDLYIAGSYDEALAVLEPAADRTGEFSDLYYLQARILEASGSPPGGWIPLLETAERIDTWQRYDRSEARLHLAKGFVHTLRYSDALHILESYLDDVLQTPEYAALYADSLSRTGRGEEADTFAAKALVLHPESERLHILRMRWSARYRDLLAERIVKDGLFRDALEMLEDIVLNHGSVPDEARAECLAFLEEHGPVSRSVQIEKLGLDGEFDESAAASLLSVLPDNRQDIERLSRVLDETDFNEQFTEALALYTGTVKDDLNDDGIYEMETVYHEGTIASVRYDGNQDGLWEFESIFGGDAPLQTILVHEDSTYTVAYNPYPYVRHIELSTSTSTSSLELAEGSYIYPFYTHIETALLPAASLSIRDLPETDHLLTLAGRIVTVYRDSSETAKYVVENTGPVKRVRTYERDILVMESDYENGELRRIVKDTDHDGRFEVEERFFAGGAVEVLYDDDGDGISDYRYSFIDDTEEWDFNDDGSVDCREVRGEDAVRRVYSTEMNGSFDVIIHIGDEFTRNGQTVPVFDDSFGNHWIGTRPREDLLDELTGSPLPQSDGTRLMSFSINGIRYIEVIR